MTPRPRKREITRLAAGLLLALLAGCGSEEAEQPQLLSVNSPTKDEDPSVIRALDGTLWVAWFSDRGNNPDIYLAHSADSRTFGPPLRLTTDPGGDFAPSLYQDANGRFHLAWFRWTAINLGHIYYRYSDDGVNWSPEEQVTTTPGVDDWVPAITDVANGTLLVYFVSDLRDTTAGSDIYVAGKPPGGAWGAAVRPTMVNSATENDHLPYVTRVLGGLALAWVRNAPAALPWQSSKSDLYLSTTGDGYIFAPPTKVTTDAGNVVNVFPQIYQRPNGKYLLWLSTRSGSPVVVDMSISGSASYPGGLEEPGLPAGYSHRVTETSTPTRYLAVWVQGPEGSQDIYYQFFDRVP